MVDVRSIATGPVRQAVVRGRAERVPFDVPRGRRMLVRHLYGDPAGHGTVWLRTAPASLTACDLRYVPAGAGTGA
ncbi:hypothetical protein ACWERV_05670 [Streptomyces sp. NPDC004031]